MITVRLVGLMRTPIAACFAVTACGGGGSTTAPSPSSSQLAPPTGVTVETVVVRDRFAMLRWIPSPAAARYVIEVGSSPGSSDIGVITTDNATPQRQVTDLPIGDLFVRVKSQNDAVTSAASLELKLTIPDFRDVIESLFLGTGPYVYEPNTANQNTMGGWTPGSRIRVRASDNMDNAQRAAMSGTVEQISEATLGIVQATVTEVAPAQVIEEAFACYRVRNNCDPTIRRGEMAVLLTDNLQGWCGFTEPNGGCAWTWTGARGFFGGPHPVAAVAVQGPAADQSTIAHEIGHAIGLQHLRWNAQHQALPGIPAPTMGFPNQAVPRFSEVEIHAIQAVYSAGLTAAANRGAFIVRGLIHNR